VKKPFFLYLEPVPFFGFLETGILYFEKIRR